MVTLAETKHEQSSIELFKSALGEAQVVTDAGNLALLSGDIWAQGINADFIISPRSINDLCAAIKIAYDEGIPLNPRGAGMSYTKGYTPDRPGVGIVDMSQLNRIVEINADDMYVTVEAGCTWMALHEALSAKGLRTPFWGPLSGRTSTIGGGLSQNNAFFGAGTFGTTGDSVLCIAVVLGDGTLVRTGSAGANGAKPFFRHYGPDLTGLFCGDAGAFGYKAEITLRLIPAPEHEDWASYKFSNMDAYSQAMTKLMRENLACELFGFDPNLQRVRMKRASIMADAEALKNVVKSQGSLIKGLKEGAKVALAGRSFVDDAAHSLHFVVEGRSAAGVRENMARLKKIANTLGGEEIENSIPKIVRANPFGPLNNILGPDGERWVPVHGIVPASEGRATLTEIEAYFDSMRDGLDIHNILTGFLLTNIGTTGYLIEPVFIWPEALSEIHKQTVSPDYLAKVKSHAHNPEATVFVEKLREGVIDIFSLRGGVHFQIGRTYPYRQSRSPEVLKFIEDIKCLVDENGIINPGALGLNAVQ